MQLTQTYAAIIGGLDKQAEEELGKFAHEFSSAIEAGRVDKVVELVKEAMSSLVDNDPAFDSLLGALELAEIYGSPLEKVAVERVMPAISKAMRDIDAEMIKEAQVPAIGHAMQMVPYAPKISVQMQRPGGLSEYQKASLMLGAGGLALSAAPFVMKLMRKSEREKEIAHSLQQAMATHPELRDNPRTAMYFQTISNMAPDVAAQPELAANVLKTLHQVGPEGLSPKLIKELLEVQEALHSSRDHESVLHEAGKATGLFGKLVGGMREQKSKDDDD